MYKVKLETFEGPFDLLFHLIEKNEMDLRDIPVAVILDQYMEYINTMQELDLNITSEFILMAATLLEIKSNMLLPKVYDEGKQIEISEIDPREELVTRLLEYKKYKNIAEKLKTMFVYNVRFFRDTPDIKYVDKSLSLNYCTNDLYNVYLKITAKHENKDVTIKLYEENYTIEDKIKDFLSRLIKKPFLLFSEFIRKSRAKTEVIVSFMALLELVKLNKITAEQKQTFGDIMIKRLRSDAINE